MSEPIEARMISTRTDIGSKFIPRLFIVYANHDYDLVIALQKLLTAWGFEAFFCRQTDRPRDVAESYRRILADKLAGADLVILLLSNAFKYSNYCQAEAGATATLEKPMIQVLLPPVTQNELKDVSPVLEGRNLIDGGEPLTFVEELRTMLDNAFKVVGLPTEPEIGVERRNQTAVESALRAVSAEYRIEPPGRALTGVWPSLVDERTIGSISTHISRAVTAGETHVAIVGVSLKYSIDIVTNALRSLRRTSHAGPLTIELAHMDDQSHILHSLKDTLDIESIVRIFRANWRRIKAEWKEIGAAVGITVDVLPPVAIDYIPQQVGVRIRSIEKQWSVLYAGRCSFASAGAEARLYVGEREYHHYTSVGDPRGTDAIDVFDRYFEQYSSPRHNGATLVLNHNEWITRLESCLLTYDDIGELVLLSNTSTRLLPLIVPALQQGLSVKVFTCHPDLLPGMSAMNVRSLRESITREIEIGLDTPHPGRLELRYFHHTPTFRAALIGDQILGLQGYEIYTRNAESSTNASSTVRQEVIAPSELRLIVTRHGEHFAKLRKMVSQQCAKADREPYEVFDAGKWV